MRAVAYLFYALAALVWLVGGSTVASRFRERAGLQESFPFRSPPLRWRNLNAVERRQLLYYLAGAMTLGFIGSIIASVEFLL